MVAMFLRQAMAQDGKAAAPSLLRLSVVAAVVAGIRNCLDPAGTNRTVSPSLLPSQRQQQRIGKILARRGGDARQQ
jgi:hypothetical protein